MRLGLKTDVRDGIFTIELSGELDAGEVGQVEVALGEAEAGVGVQRIVLDITRLDFIDSSGIAVLARAAKRDQGERLLITRSRAQVERVLEITGMADLLPRGEIPGT
jgi:anti-anti-sigma factor